MDRHRTRFLAGLNARLEQDRALRENEVETPRIWRRPTERPDPTEESAPAEVPGASDRAVDLPEADDRAISNQVVSISRPPRLRGLTAEALRRRGSDPQPVQAVTWSETGMSQALRDAIASVRRVAHHEVDEPPPPRVEQARYEPRPFDDEPADEDGLLDGAGTDERASFDGLREELPFDDATAAEQFDDRVLYEEPPLAADRASAQRPFDHPAAADEWPSPPGADWANGRASLDEDAPDEEAPFDDGADEPPPFGGRSRHEEPPFNVVRPAPSLPFGGDAEDDQRIFEDDWDDEDPPQGLEESWREPVPPRRDGTQRRRLHVAALVLAPVFVLVAGFGFGILSGAQEFDRLLAPLEWASLLDGSAGANSEPATDPTPSTTSAASTTSGAAAPTSSTRASGGGAEAAPSPHLSELETVRVAPLPAAARTEQTPDPATSNMPLPPPPKPAPWSSLSGETSSASDRVESAADTAAVAVLAADGAVEDAVEDAAVALHDAGGAGGVFEPILVKTSSFEPRVFVHYAEDAPGSPATALHLVRHLRAAGFTVEGRVVASPISEDSIRYFFAGDRDEAEALSAWLQGQIPGGAAVPIVDFTSYEPKPRRGHLEVWLAG